MDRDKLVKELILDEGYIYEIYKDHLGYLYWWRELDDNKQRVMVNMCFNLGYPRLSKFKKFLAAMEVHDFETAAIEMMDSKWANQVGLRAERLKKRVLEK